MTPAQRQLVETIRDRFGPRSVVTDPAEIEPWLIDWRRRFHGDTPAMLAPDSTEAVAAIVGLAAGLRVPLVPQGGNTGMVGGAVPPGDGSALLLSLRRLDRLRRIDADLAVAEAGVVLHTLHAAAHAIGRRFPLDLGARGSATIGGLVSTNAGGVQVLRFGTMRSLVAGVEAVLPDGSIHDGLAALRKDNRGYSLDQLLIGAEGTLGVVTAAALRLVPAAVARGVAWVGVDSPARALALLRALETQTPTIESFEILPDIALRDVLAHIPGTRAPLAGAWPWHVLIESVATDPAAEPPADLLARLLAPAIADATLGDGVVAVSEAQAEAFWRIRHSVSEAERAAGPAVQHDIAVPVADMPRFLVDAAAAIEARFPGTRAIAYGHLGDGNVHFHVRAPAGVARDAWLAGDARAITRAVHDLVVAAAGTISAEHGIGQMKRDELARVLPPARLAAMRSIKAALDPYAILNPGKLLALAPGRATP